MTVSNAYLAKMRRAIRVKYDVDINAELVDIIEECRADLKAVGVKKADDENNARILGAVRCYVRWKFGLNNPEADLNREGYEQLKSEMMRSKDYAWFRLTIKTGTPNIRVKLGDKLAQTNAEGNAVFEYLDDGWYEWSALGQDGKVYVDKDTEIDVGE